MAAPRFVPADPTAAPRAYRSPAHVPGSWTGRRPGAIGGRQPTGPRLGHQGPDQGYALALAARLRDRVIVTPGEDVDDVLAGCVAIALRRASLFGRAPVAHDLTVALTVWGFLDDAAPAELVELRRGVFEGLADAHHYAEVRALAASVPESTLRLTPDRARQAYRQNWRAALGR
jgi:hypothetical protein